MSFELLVLDEESRFLEVTDLPPGLGYSREQLGSPQFLDLSIRPPSGSSPIDPPPAGLRVDWQDHYSASDDGGNETVERTSFRLDDNELHFRHELDTCFAPSGPPQGIAMTSEMLAAMPPSTSGPTVLEISAKRLTETTFRVLLNEREHHAHPSPFALPPSLDESPTALAQPEPPAPAHEDHPLICCQVKEKFYVRLEGTLMPWVSVTQPIPRQSIPPPGHLQEMWDSWNTIPMAASDPMDNCFDIVRPDFDLPPPPPPLEEELVPLVAFPLQETQDSENEDKGQ